MHSTSELPVWDDRWVLARRPDYLEPDPWQPHGTLIELERTRTGTVEPVGTMFLANRECPFRCVMCDLWKFTTRQRVPAGAVSSQVRQALDQLPGIAHLKLYNAGNFFDAQAIAPAEHAEIARLIAHARTVLVECHPLLIGPRILPFRDLLDGELQVAMGLETIHPEVLPRLNKRMTLDDFARACDFLRKHDVPVRAFILLRPPLLDEGEGLDWACRSVAWAQDQGVECCTIIPVRTGNGAMEELQRQGLFHPPTLASLETALAHGIALGRGRVFADLWNVELIAPCSRCARERIERLERMNHEQTRVAPVQCTCEGMA